MAGLFLVAKDRQATSNEINFFGTYIQKSNGPSFQRGLAIDAPWHIKVLVMNVQPNTI